MRLLLLPLLYVPALACSIALEVERAELHRGELPDCLIAEVYAPGGVASAAVAFRNTCELPVVVDCVDWCGDERTEIAPGEEVVFSENARDPYELSVEVGEEVFPMQVTVEYQEIMGDPCGDFEPDTVEDEGCQSAPGPAPYALLMIPALATAGRRRRRGSGAS